MATHSSTLAWKIPCMEEPGRLQSMGSQRVRDRDDWATSLVQLLSFQSLFCFFFFFFANSMSRLSLALCMLIMYQSLLCDFSEYCINYDSKLLKIYHKDFPKKCFHFFFLIDNFGSVKFSRSVVSDSDISWTAACHHQLPELAQTYVHQVSNAIKLSHPLLSSSLPVFHLS